MQPKKLIRSAIIEKLKEGEWEIIIDQDELNKLYVIKIREELAEVQASEYKDIFEFADLIQVAFSFAEQNGFTYEQLIQAMVTKSFDKGSFGKLVLNNLNPSNPSNKLYFENIK
jgi:predicted house-cleaning noncanonical NTP pyrophosphatase (MazG superfamily)